MTARAFEVTFKAAFWLAVALTLFFALVPQPPQVVPLPSDKAQHALAFAVLSVSCLLAYPGLARLPMFLALAGFGGAIELAQTIPALNRSGDLLDWLVDMAAVAVVLPVASFLYRRFGAPGGEKRSADDRA